ncbi:NEL-type E3 ubiquitin ligase domain-containing protein [Pseudomonas sp. EA_15y_Pfl1_P104]|uniref:NEL-type E3 ubiquitin ligase domain-containing protein n=1 Tax=Pseudomonas sp. EA_15y_Pfl1_P104 TaxID=3088686 RepID=UPI0030D76746
MPVTPDAVITLNLPDWLRSTAWPRAQRLQGASMAALTTFHRLAGTPQAPLKRANAHAWRAQNSVDKRLDAVLDLHAFAEPLLTHALKQRYALHLDVKAIYLFLHSEKGTWLKGTTSRSVSLLDAALHNFARSEVFSTDSSYITRPDARGHFMITPMKDRMSIAQFVTLCRELDLGAQYQRHLQRYLQPPAKADKDALQTEVIASQKAALNAAAHLALHTGELDAATFHLVQRAVAGERGVMQFYQLRIQDTQLTGILLIAPDLLAATTLVPIVMYIPHELKTPIKQYVSTVALMDDLQARLKDTGYPAFFSQFVDQQQRGRFFSALQQRPRFEATLINGDLWQHRYQSMLNKILNDGRELAVATAYADSRARWSWWDNFSQLLEEVFNAALLVITPFVPLLGELTLAYTAYQLLDEVVEGVVDLTEGQAREAAGHLIGVVSQVVQLGAFGVAGHFAQSAFVNQLKPISFNGKTQLWNPDPKPYAQPRLDLPADLTPDERGLLQHNDRSLLPVDGQHYAVALDAPEATYRVQHASRPDAYAPPLQYLDQPQAWSEQQLWRQLGPFSDEQQAHIRSISGVDHGVLRAVQSEHLRAPLLDDTVKRVRLSQDTRDMVQRLREGKPVDQDTYWSPHLARELQGWPADVAIDVYENADLSGACLRFGEPDAGEVLAISQEALNQGTLPERLLDVLDDTQLSALLGELPDQRPARIQALRERLADNLERRHGAVFDYLYRNSEELHDETALRVRQAMPDLPKSLLQSVLDHARPAELRRLREEQRLPLRLKNLAREWQWQARAAHAFQGLHEPELFGADAEQMSLNTLRVNSDALGDCRIEVRQQHLQGTLRASAGPQGARRTRVLVAHDGGYQLYDERQHALQHMDDFFDALLLALPVDTSAALKLNEGTTLKRWLMDRIQTPQQRRSLFEPAGKPANAPRDALVLTQKPMHRMGQWMCELFPTSLRDRVKALYPFAPQIVIETYLLGLDDSVQRDLFEARALEKSRLEEDLNNWLDAAPALEHPHMGRIKQELATALLRTWEQNIDPDPDGFGLTLNGVELSGLLSDLRLRTRFEHILQLDLIDAELTDSDTHFLSVFPRLHNLDLSGNGLTRLPDALTGMRSLTTLNLDRTPIQWEAHGLAKLSGMRRLRRLSLADNRNLTVAPNLSQLPDLRWLCLRNTAISEWPQGLFPRRSPAHFFLDIQHTAIIDVPAFLPWQPEAELVARVRLDRNHLTTDAEKRLVSYRIEAGLDPFRLYPPKGDAAYWLELETPEHSPWLRQLWQELEEEHGSQGFFEVIKSLEPSAYFEDPNDEAMFAQGRRELTAKVWRMLLAMQGDEALRLRLFLMANNPLTCADAGAHVFNAMGYEVLLVEINRDLLGLDRDLKLSHLARGKTRLDRLNKVAQAAIRLRITAPEEGGHGLRFTTDVIDGVPGTVDEVEVYLAYHTGLKRRLDLPWIAEHMTYRMTAQVDEPSLETAYNQVIAQEAGDGLAAGMLDQPFWVEYLHARHAEQFAASLDRGYELIGPLDELRDAQDQWAKGQSRPPEEQPTLKQHLLTLADALNVPHDVVLTGKPMTTETYERLLAGGFTDDQISETALAHQLTRNALHRLNDYESGRGTPQQAH